MLSNFIFYNSCDCILKPRRKISGLIRIIWCFMVIGPSLTKCVTIHKSVYWPRLAWKRSSKFGVHSNWTIVAAVWPMMVQSMSGTYSLTRNVFRYWTQVTAWRMTTVIRTLPRTRGWWHVSNLFSPPSLAGINSSSSSFWFIGATWNWGLEQQWQFGYWQEQRP